MGILGAMGILGTPGTAGLLVGGERVQSHGNGSPPSQVERVLICSAHLTHPAHVRVLLDLTDRLGGSAKSRNRSFCVLRKTKTGNFSVVTLRLETGNLKKFFFFLLTKEIRGIIVSGKC